MHKRLLSSLVLGALAGCKVVEAKVWNLEQTHEADGQIRRVGAPMGDLEFVLRNVLGAFQGAQFLQDVAAGNAVPIDDPLEISLEALYELGAIRPRNAHTSGLQVQQFGWLAVEDEYVLARERAVIELGHAALRLGLVQAAAGPSAEQALSPEQLLPSLRALLVESADLLGLPLVALEQDEQAAVVVEPRSSLSAACERLRGLALDRQGTRRALALTTLLVGRAPEHHPEFAPLFALHGDLELQLTSQALFAASSDPSDWVRAAALEARLRAASAAMSRAPEQARQARGDLLLAGLAERGQETSVRCLALIEELGLDGLEETQRALVFEGLVRLAGHPDGRRSAAAGRALSARAGAGIHSQRFEDWLSWWSLRQTPGAGLGPQH